MTAGLDGGSVRSRDLARLGELTGPHQPYPGAPTQQALVHLTVDDRAATSAILDRLGGLDESAPAWS